jgi:predicted O-methyltransferase YrrM
MATSASQVFRNTRRIVTDHLFPRVFASLDHHYGSRQVPPLNGQSGRAAIIEEIVHGCSVEQIVETGTYRGATTAWLTRFGLPVYTVETNPRFAHLARLRFAEVALVHPVEMDSASFLERLAGDVGRTAPVTLFYLDAHWEQRLPLDEELRIVGRAFSSAVVVIDDFEVPDDPAYGFDDYGPGKRLDLDYVKGSGVKGLSAFFPRLPGLEESGARRGCVVLTSSAQIAGVLQRAPLLRAYPV